MKILFVQDSFGAGGAESSNLLLWRFLKNQGVIIHIIVLTHKKEGYEDDVVSEGYNVVFLKPGNIIQHSLQIAKHIKIISPDIVHSVLFKSNLRVRLAKLHVNFFHVEHLVSSTYDKVRLSDPKINKLGFHVYKYIDILTSIYGVNYFIAITDLVKKHYCKEVKINESKIRVIYRGRYDNNFISQKYLLKKELFNEFGLNNDNIILTHVGRQEFAKGHLVLLKALTKLYHHEFELWDRIKVLFCGRQGNETAAILAYLEKHQYLSTNIEWLGQRKDVPKLLVASDIFVFPSLYEGLGGSLIEAQAAALPVICSDLPVFQEVVNEHENALMFPVADEDKLSEQIIKLAKDPSLRSKMGVNSLANFNKKFRLDKINEETLKFYKQISP